MCFDGVVCLLAGQQQVRPIVVRTSTVKNSPQNEWGSWWRRTRGCGSSILTNTELMTTPVGVPVLARWWTHSARRLWWNGLTAKLYPLPGNIAALHLILAQLSTRVANNAASSTRPPGWRFKSCRSKLNDCHGKKHRAVHRAGHQKNVSKL